MAIDERPRESRAMALGAHTAGVAAVIGWLLNDPAGLSAVTLIVAALVAAVVWTALRIAVLAVAVVVGSIVRRLPRRGASRSAY